MFENLKVAIVADIYKRYTLTPDDFVKLKDEDGREEKEPRAYRLLGRKWNAKPYAGTPEQVTAKIIGARDKMRAGEIEHNLAKLAAAEAAPDTLPSPLIIRVDWTDNRTWGATAKARDNYGHVSDVASGCGYDKQSTATAGVLNQHQTILKRLYAARDAEMTGENRAVLGYGSGYGLPPYFEGGVGVNCHVEILEKIGFSATYSNDVLMVTEKK